MATYRGRFAHRTCPPLTHPKAVGIAMCARTGTTPATLCRQ